jgi:biopolymer transport protein ExbD
MAGVDVGAGGGGGRKALDSEINMIPMIDLLMVTISFLLITAVWSHTARLDSDALVPGPTRDPPVVAAPEKRLDVEMQVGDRFTLVWKQGDTTLESVDVPRREVVVRQGAVEVVRFPDLAATVESEWKARGQHASATDPRLDQAVLHTDNKTPFRDVVAAIDAIYQAHREVASAAGKVRRVSAFNLTFAAD